jgi:opacity protein-like surface antigen
MIRHYRLLAGIFVVSMSATSLALALEDRASPGGPTTPDAAYEEKSEDSKPKDHGWYVGFGLGFADDKGLDDDGDGFKVFGGYRFNKYIALEGAVVSLGDDLGRIDAVKDGISVQAVAIWPVRKKLGLFAKLGFFDWEERVGSGEFECFSVIGGFTCVEEEDKIDDGTDTAYGLGLDYHISKRWSFRAEWERFVDVGEGDVDLISFGSLFRF